MDVFRPEPGLGAAQFTDRVSFGRTAPLNACLASSPALEENEMADLVKRLDELKK
jgi:hypothetical protein